MCIYMSLCSFAEPLVPQSHSHICHNFRSEFQSLQLARAYALHHGNCSVISRIIFSPLLSSPRNTQDPSGSQEVAQSVRTCSSNSSKRAVSALIASASLSSDTNSVESAMAQGKTTRRPQATPFQGSPRRDLNSGAHSQQSVFCPKT